MTSADASTMTADDQRLADILSLLSSIDERLPKRRVKAAATTAVPVELESDVTPAEKPKRARKPSAKAAAAKAAEPQPELEEEDEPTPAPAKPARKPRVKKATVPADSPTTC
jgi:hypothetical protein